MTALLAEARKLTIAERIELVEAIWESIADEARDEDLPVSPAHRELLDQRLADLAARPDDESSWEEVRDRLERHV